jgi:5-methyltetrahydropteroyltriglutamate--homocysteine methyltransferase
MPGEVKDHSTEIHGGGVTIPTEPIGSISRPLSLISAIERFGADDARLDPLYEDAIRDREQFEASGSPVISDGEQ